MSFLTQIDPDKYPQTPFSPFSLEARFSLSNASAMAWMSQLAYEATDLLNPNARVAAIGAKLGLQATAFAHSFSSRLRMTSARGVIAVGPNAIVVAFTGTEPLSAIDWAADFQFRLSFDDVHKGFEAAVAAACATIKPAIAANVAGGKALFFAGHSMGGALAVILRHAPSKRK
jgi:triacylglycerol lipase